MKGEYNYLRLTLRDMISDIICTEKSYKQEMNSKQLCIVVNNLMTKTDIIKGLKYLMPDLEIKSIQVIVIRKTQYAKKTGRYTFQTGSNRSHLKGNKKFIIGVKDINPLLEYVNKI